MTGSGIFIILIDLIGVLFPTESRLLGRIGVLNMKFLLVRRTAGLDVEFCSRVFNGLDRLLMNDMLLKEVCVGFCIGVLVLEGKFAVDELAFCIVYIVCIYFISSFSTQRVCYCCVCVWRLNDYWLLCLCCISNVTSA
mgnify:CR=1 FL=1